MTASGKARPDTAGGTPRRGFTLVELLVVIGIIALLVAILVPSLSAARDRAKQAVCLARVHAQVQAVQMYAAEREGAIPCGPGVEMYPGWPVNVLASYQIWLKAGPLSVHSAHGILLTAGLLGPEAMFCPDDRFSDVEAEYERFRTQSDTAYCAYLYRQLDGQAANPPGTKLEHLGTNAKGDKVAALVMDMHNLLDFPGLPLRSNHGGLRTSIGFLHGGAAAFDNSSQAMTLRNEDNDGGYGVFYRLDAILEHADSLAP